jgi:peptidoglycan-associated lipoprotein
MNVHDALLKVSLLSLVAVFLLAFSACEKQKPKTGVSETYPSAMEGQDQAGAEGASIISEEELEAQRRQAAEALQREKEAAQEAFVNQDVYFEFDDASLNWEAMSVLKQKVRWLKANPDVSVVIQGHCDERGTEAYNIALGQRRAQSILTYLVNAGIDPSRLQAVSYGEEMPVDSGHNESAWAKNRRGHFQIVTP